jgi:protoporphyrinogen oxidase
MDLSTENPLKEQPDEDVFVLGGGLAGLAAGYSLTKANISTTVIEAGPVVGGLSRTERVGEFLYDLGGHRFHTKDKDVDNFIRMLMGDELIEVSRSSKIFLKDRFFDYPLKPLNAIGGLGAFTVARIMADYAFERARSVLGNGRCVSLEDWVVKKFGRTMFNIYFKQYSEKVWGIDCKRISEKWVAKRIRGLSLWSALKNAFFKFSGKDIPTLVDSFVYPRLGIGRISDRLREEIETTNSVLTSSPVIKVKRSGKRITSLMVGGPSGETDVQPGAVISTIPVNTLVKMMDPAPPDDVLEAASNLRFRDLLLVTVMVDRENVTDQTWIYIPEKKIPFGRLHEPKNWSPDMAPAGKTHLVVEYFCFRGDDVWDTSDEEISRQTIEGLEDLGFIESGQVIGTEVLRVPRAYPLFEVGFEDNVQRLFDWLDDFENLHMAGRSGMFEYYNMDHAIISGFEVADEIIGEKVKS